jgi:hypothetical protein
MTERTRPSLLNQNFFHHPDQFVVIENLLDDVRMGLSIVFSVRKATFPTHLSSPSKEHYKISVFFWQENEIVNVSGDTEGIRPL